MTQRFTHKMQFTKKAAVILTAMGLIPAGLFVSPVRAMSLTEAVRIAIVEHPAVQASVAALGASGYAVKDARADYYPSLDLQGDTGHQFSDTTTTRGRGLGGEDTWRRSMEARLTQNLFDGFSTRYRVKAAEKQMEFLRHQLLDTRESIALRVVEAYLGVLRGQKVLELSGKNIERHREVLRDVRVKAEKGGGNWGDVNQAESRLALAESRLTLVKGELREAEAAFLEAVGITATDLARPESVAPVPSSLRDAIATALRNNPTVMAAATAIEASEADFKAANAAFMPKFNLELSESRGWDTDGLEERTLDKRALVTMQFNLFRGGGDVARKKQAYELLAETRQKYHESVRAVEKQMRIDYSAFETARDRIEALKARAIASAEAVAAYQSQFRFGRRSMLDVLDVENELFQAKVALVDVDLQHRVSRYRVLATMGSLLESPELDSRTVVPSEDILTVPREREKPSRTNILRYPAAPENGEDKSGENKLNRDTAVQPESDPAPVESGLKDASP